MGRARSRKEKLGELLANTIEKIRKTYVPSGSCGNVYKMVKRLWQFESISTVVEELARKAGATVSFDTLINLGYYQIGGGLKRNADFVGAYTEAEIRLDHEPVAVATIHEYITCESGILVIKADAHISKFYDEDVRRAYCKKLPDTSCWSNSTA